MTFFRFAIITFIGRALFWSYLSFGGTYNQGIWNTTFCIFRSGGKCDTFLCFCKVAAFSNTLQWLNCLLADIFDVWVEEVETSLTSKGSQDLGTGLTSLICWVTHLQRTSFHGKLNQRRPLWTSLSWLIPAPSLFFSFLLFSASSPHMWRPAI